MPGPEPVLICALSARALAQAARAAGFAPIILDAFADLDTRAAAAAWRRVPVDAKWRLRRGPLLAAAEALAPPPIPLVWGSGFDRSPALLAQLAAGRELWGSTAPTLRAAKDPVAFAATAAGLGVPHPAVRGTPPPRLDGWLCKRAGGAGGGHVHRARGVRPPRGRGWYWQRRAAGEPVAALVAGDGRGAARLLALGRQLTAPLPGHPFRFGGTLAPADAVTTTARRRLEEAALGLAGRYGVRGLASVDALVDGDAVTVLELNPRPGGSLDAYGRALGRNLFAVHVAACRDGRLPEPTPPPAGHAGSLVAYADRALRVPSGFAWPDWAGDRSPPGSAVPARGPVCTVFAAGADAGEVRRVLVARAGEIRAALAQAAPPLAQDRSAPMTGER